MSSDDEDLSVTRNETYLFPLVLVVVVGGGLALEITGFVKMVPSKYNNETSHLCDLVPTSDQCTSFNNESRPPNDTTDYRSKGEIIFDFFVGAQGLCIFVQFFALMFIFCRISVCLKVFNWICGCRKCAGIVVLCALFCQCRFGWIVVEFVSGALCIVSSLILGCVLSPGDIYQIDGFKFCVIFGVFNILKVALSIVYHMKIGCPPGDIFFGTNLRFSDVRINEEMLEGPTKKMWLVDGFGRKIPDTTEIRKSADTIFDVIEIKKRY